MSPLQTNITFVDSHSSHKEVHSLKIVTVYLKVFFHCSLASGGIVLLT